MCSSRFSTNERSLSDIIQKRYNDLKKRLDDYVTTILADTTHMNTKALRATGYRLAVDATELARLTHSGHALLSNHPTQRLSREVWQYAVAGTNPQQLDAYYK